MPVYDASYMLRDGSSSLTATANGTGILVGGAPGNGMKVFVYVPAVSGTSPTLDVHLEESDALASGYADVVNAVVPQITAAGYYEIGHVFWTKPYLRAVFTLGGTTPDFGATKIGLTPGGIPTT